MMILPTIPAILSILNITILNCVFTRDKTLTHSCHQPCLTPGSTLGYTRVNPGWSQGWPWGQAGLTLLDPRAAGTAWHQGQPCLTPGSTLGSTRVDPGLPQGWPWGQAGSTLVYPRVDPGVKQGWPWFTPGLTLVDSGFFFGGSPNNPNLTSIQLKCTVGNVFRDTLFSYMLSDLLLSLVNW